MVVDDNDISGAALKSLREISEISSYPCTQAYSFKYMIEYEGCLMGFYILEHILLGFMLFLFSKVRLCFSTKVRTTFTLLKLGSTI